MFWTEFAADIDNSRLLIGHNIDFDINIVAAEFLRTGISAIHSLRSRNYAPRLKVLISVPFPEVRVENSNGRTWRNSTVNYSTKISANAHNASADVVATARCFFELAQTRYCKGK